MTTLIQWIIPIAIIWYFWPRNEVLAFDYRRGQYGIGFDWVRGVVRWKMGFISKTYIVSGKGRTLYDQKGREMFGMLVGYPVARLTNLVAAGIEVEPFPQVGGDT
jgi:hypothetical protein